MPEDARQPTQNISPSSREPDSKDFVRAYWTASVKLRNCQATKAVMGRSLLWQLPPRPVRMGLLMLSLAGTRQRNPGGRKSPRAPMTASATLAPRAGANDVFHRSTTCKFPAPVLRACSSAHRIPEPVDAGGCRRSPTATSAYGRICFRREFRGTSQYWMPAPLPCLHLLQLHRLSTSTFSAPAPTH
jgi:hypothetical protein